MNDEGIKGAGSGGGGRVNKYSSEQTNKPRTRRIVAVSYSRRGANTLHCTQPHNVRKPQALTARSLDRSLDRSLAPSLAFSIARSLARLIARSDEHDVQSHRHARQVLWRLLRYSFCSKPIQRKTKKRWRGRRPQCNKQQMSFVGPCELCKAMRGLQGHASLKGTCDFH